MKTVNNILTIILAICVLIQIFPLNVFANTEAPSDTVSGEEKYEYAIDEESQTVTITGIKNYKYFSSDVIIPEELEGYPVTSIGLWAFYFGSDEYNFPCLKNLFIPKTVTKIGYQAFRGSLETIEVDDENPVYHSDGNCLIETETKTLICGSVSCLIPDDGSVTIIGDGAFRDSDLEAIIIPNTITHIDHYAFSGTNLKQIVIPDSVTSMSGYCTFDYCRELDSVHIGKGLQSFTSLWRIFAYCDNLKSITVDEENQSFYSEGNCIINKETKTLIAGCNNSTISSESSIKSIGNCAFEGCTNLRTITLPDSVISIESYAFSECSNLQSIFIPKNVTYIGSGSFDCCSNLSEIKVDCDNLTYHAIDNCLIYTSRKILINGCYNSIIPADGSVEYIGANAFYGQGKLYYLEIPEGVKTIGDSAFCLTSLYAVSLPSTLQTIYAQNFNGWGTLKYILYNGSEAERENIRCIESWEGQNSDFDLAQWYYNGEKPFADINLTATSVECMELINGNYWYRGEEKIFFEYKINPQIKISFADGTEFVGNKDEIEAELGFSVGILHNQSEGNQWGVGVHSAKVCLLNHSVDIKVTVIEHPVERIEVKDVVLLEETSGYMNEFGYTYNIVPEYTVFFKDGSKTTVYVDEKDPCSSEYLIIGGKHIGLKTNGWSLQENSPWVAGNTYQLTGSFLDAYDTFTVTIKKKSLANIAVIKRPDKLTYVVGEPLDISGMIVQLYYDNGYSERIADYVVSDYDNSFIGEQNILVSYNGCETTFKINVLPINVTGIDLSQNEAAIITGQSIALDATIYPSNATDKTIIWESSNPEVAQVDSSGSVKALIAGETNITATTKDGAFSATCKIYVACNHATLIYHPETRPSCKVDGNAPYYTCLTCENVYKNDKCTITTIENEIKNALGHNLDNGTVTKKPTCTEKGTKTYNCTVCGEVTGTESVPVVPHDYTAATCTKPQTCKDCGASTGKATGHSFSATNDATCNNCDFTRGIASITTQPVSVVVANSEQATVTVTAQGDDLTYEWYFKNKGESTYNLSTTCLGNSYSLAMNSLRDGRSVYCIVTDKYGNSVTSSVATINMTKSVAITKQPTSVTVANGAQATVTVTATGDGLTYKWYFKNKGESTYNLSGTCTGNSYSLAMNSTRDGRSVYCVITDKYGNFVKSSVATINMKKTALAITKQPVGVTVANGAMATVTVTATGDGLTYKWYFKNKGETAYNLSGTCTGKSYSLAMNSTRDGRSVYCVITDKYGNSVKSSVVTINMKKTGPTITKQPTSVTVANGAQATVTVTATGEGLSYKWYFKNKGSSTYEISTTCTGNSYSLAMNSARDGRSVYCVITDKYGNSVKSSVATINMKKTGPTITKQPTSVTVANGEMATVTVTVTGEGLTYKWYFKNKGESTYNLSGTCTGKSYSLAMNSTRDGRSVYCIVTDKYGNSVTSSVATINMTKSVAITKQPTSITATKGTNTKFTVTATGEGLKYQWQFISSSSGAWANSSMAGSNTATMTVGATAARNGYKYRCIITDKYGNKVTSSAATLYVK